MLWSKKEKTVVLDFLSNLRENSPLSVAGKVCCNVEARRENEMGERIPITKCAIRTESGERLTLCYELLVDPVELPVGNTLEFYGVAVRVEETGEQACIRQIWISSGHATTEIWKLAAHRVTPCTLRDVLEDLAAEAQLQY